MNEKQRSTVSNIWVLLLIAVPFLLMIPIPPVRRFLPLANFLMILLLAATPFVIAILVWRIKLWLQARRGTPSMALPPDSI
jgi:hypothetical protein